MIHLEQAIRDIEQAFCGRLTPEAIRFLDKQGILQNYQAGIITSQKAANQVAQIWNPTPTSQSEHRSEAIANKTSLAEKNLASCISEILALRANREPQVIAFRTTHLNGEFLSQDSIDSWVAQTINHEGVSTAGSELVYMTEFSKVPTSICVVEDGVLDELRELSELLAHNYGWQLEQASSFVLSNSTPHVESIQVGAEVYPNHPFRNRVTLEIDPTIAPEEVVKAYTWARGQWFETRSRHQSIKHQNLALFHAQHVEYAEVKEKRAILLEKWNALCTSQTNLDELPDEPVNDSEEQVQESDFSWYQKSIMEKFPELGQESDYIASIPNTSPPKRKNIEENWKYDPSNGLSNFQRDSRKAYLELVRDKFKKKEIDTDLK